MPAVLLNCAVVLACGGLGLVLKERLPKTLLDGLMQAMGLCVMVIGISGAVATNDMLCVLVCLAAGTVLGTLLNIEGRLDRLGETLRQRFDRGGSGSFTQGFVTASLMFCVGAMAIVGNAEAVVKFGAKLSRISPQKAPMLCYAVALANSGELREARKIMVTLQALFPYDAVVRVFSVIIGNLTEKSELSLLCELPENAENEILYSLNNVLTECGNDKNKLKNRLREPEFYTGILMVFQMGSDNSKRLLAEMVADIPYFERYIRDCLMDPGYPDADKRILLPVAIEKFKRRPVYLTCRDVCRPLYGKAPAKAPRAWRMAYCIACSAIALFGCEDYENELDAAFDKLHDALSSGGSVDETAAAAVVANRIKPVSPLADDECCIELFGADKETYFDYKKRIGKSGRKQNTKG